MHELYWTPPKELARNRTEEEVEEIQERIEDRGGSKKENVYDVIKRDKKKLRLKNVMDQKANSIADLAAVLVEQEEISAQDAGEYEFDETELMLRLDAKVRNGALEELEADIERLNKRIKEFVEETPVSKGGEDTRSHVRTMRALRNRTRKALRNAQSEKEKLEHALLMASMATPREVEPAAESQAVETGSEAQAEQAERQEQEAISGQEVVTRQKTVSKRKHPILIPKPAFSMEGVKVTWQNILDAEFAPAWPASVQHDWMGITRHAAPKPGVEPSMTAQEYYESKRRVKAEEEEEEETNVREGVVKSVSAAIIRQLIGRRRNDQSVERRRDSGKKKDAGAKVAFQPAGESESVQQTFR
jgi:hypothetical protein